MFIDYPALLTAALAHPLIGPLLAEYLGIPTEALFINELAQNFPNPFNPITAINYSLAVADEVELTVYSTIGQVVRTLVAEKKTAGNHTVRWDGTDSNGLRVASGLYLYRITSGSFTDVRKMLLLK